MLTNRGPERAGGQGLDPNQYESGDRTIATLVAGSPAADHVDFVATWRDGAYEVWARRGMIRFKRLADEARNLHFEIIEQIGENPIANEDPFAVSTIAEELAAARESGFGDDDANRAFHEPHALSHPYAMERVAQIFDSPRGPDLIVSPKSYAYGVQAGQHGALDAVQSRAPLIFSGPGIRSGSFRIAARQVDIAPTIGHMMGFPALDGRAGNYMRRQDGKALTQLADRAKRPERVYMIVMDGLSHSELVHQLAASPEMIPNLARLIGAGAMLSHGSTANFPSITWPSHSAILTGAWSGHHDVVNPTFHLRETRETIPAQGNIFDTEKYLSHDVETLYEAFKRVRGGDALTASIHEPQCRGADHAVFERRIVGDKARLKEITAALVHDISPRWTQAENPAMHREEIVDIRGMAQAIMLLEHSDTPPAFVAHEFVLTDGAGHEFGPHHEGLREALCRTDRRIGALLDMMRRRGILDSTLFVITSDHGMAAQRVELAANPTVEPARTGIKAVYAEPMIYLRDLAIECARTRDGRMLRVSASDNGCSEPVEGVRVKVERRNGETIGEASTSGTGHVALATPANLRDDEVIVRITHPEYNCRNVDARGRAIHRDIREVIYPGIARNA